jgi:hypothetical protein
MLPTKVNFAIRGIISPESQSCIAGCGGMESTQHLFMYCIIFGSLWPAVRLWVGLSSTDPQNSDFFYSSLIHQVAFRRDTPITTYLALMCLSHLEWKKSTVIENQNCP